MKLNIFIWMVFSIVCFSIFNAYRYVEDKELDVLLLTILFVFIGCYTLFKMMDSLCESKIFKDKILNYFWIFNGMAIPISIWFMKNHTQLVTYLIYQFGILTIVGITVNGINQLKKKKSKRSKNVQSKKKNKA